MGSFLTLIYVDQVNQDLNSCCTHRAFQLPSSGKWYLSWKKTPDPFDHSTIRAPFKTYLEELLKRSEAHRCGTTPSPISTDRRRRRRRRNGKPFDFLQPADHPINAMGVPNSFYPLPPCEAFDIQCDNVGSSSVTHSIHNESS